MNVRLDLDPEEESLLQSAKLGDGKAISELIRRYAPLVRSRAKVYARESLDMEDLYQEGMIALLKAVRYYRPGSSGSFRTFAAVCLNNKMRSAIAAHMRQKNAPMRSYLSFSDEGFGFGDVPASPEETNPEQIVIAGEETDVRRRQIETLLSSFERQVLRLYLSSCSYEEMARQLSSTTKAVDNALQRVRRKLRSALIDR